MTTRGQRVEVRAHGAVVRVGTRDAATGFGARGPATRRAAYGRAVGEEFGDTLMARLNPERTGTGRVTSRRRGGSQEGRVSLPGPAEIEALVRTTLGSGRRLEGMELRELAEAARDPQVVDRWEVVKGTLDMSPYELGWLAAERGGDLKANPFLKGTGEEISWRWGYRAMLESVGGPATRRAETGSDDARYDEEERTARGGTIRDALRRAARAGVRDADYSKLDNGQLREAYNRHVGANRPSEAAAVRAEQERRARSTTYTPNRREPGEEHVPTGAGRSIPKSQVNRVTKSLLGWR